MNLYPIEKFSSPGKSLYLFSPGKDAPATLRMRATAEPVRVLRVSRYIPETGRWRRVLKVSIHGGKERLSHVVHRVIEAAVAVVYGPQPVVYGEEPHETQTMLDTYDADPALFPIYPDPHP